MSLLISIFLFTGTALSASISCKKHLIKRTWPLDCILELHLKNFDLKTKPYQNLNLWCKTFKRELSIRRPPKAIFSLQLPQTCKEIAFLAEEHHKKIDILTGDFLNSLP